MTAERLKCAERSSAENEHQIVCHSKALIHKKSKPKSNIKSYVTAKPKSNKCSAESEQRKANSE